MLEKLLISLFFIGFAVTAPLPRPIRNYLLAEFFAAPFIFLTAYWYTSNSLEFLIVFAFVTWMLVLVGFAALWPYLRWNPYKLAIIPLAFDIALVMAFIAYLGLPKPLWPDDWVNLSAGLLRTVLWASVAFATRRIHPSELKLIAPLALFWLVRSLWDFGYPMHMPAWAHLNWTVPWVAQLASLAILGLLARQNYRQRHPSPG